MKPKAKAEQWETDDERYGRNIRMLRERKGLSQTAVAEAMTARGHPWHQQTVTRVESGRQPLKFSEADALVGILETSADRLTWSSPEAQQTEFMYAAGTSVRLAYETVADAIRDLIVAIHHAEKWADTYKDSPSPRVQEARGDALGRVEMYGVDEAVDEGIRRSQGRGSDAP